MVNIHTTSYFCRAFVHTVPASALLLLPDSPDQFLPIARDIESMNISGCNQRKDPRRRPHIRVILHCQLISQAFVIFPDDASQLIPGLIAFLLPAIRYKDGCLIKNHPGQESNARKNQHKQQDSRDTAGNSQAYSVHELEPYSKISHIQSPFEFLAKQKSLHQAPHHLCGYMAQAQRLRLLGNIHDGFFFADFAVNREVLYLCIRKNTENFSPFAHWAFNPTFVCIYSITFRFRCQLVSAPLSPALWLKTLHIYEA